ncbi:MAG: hypothetical protein AAGA47_02050 [Pseudomonadota bacterium]
MAQARAKTLIDRLPAHACAAPLSTIIAKLRDGPYKVTLDASLVEGLEPADLEAMLVISQTQNARGDAFRLNSPSEAFLADIARYGVTPEQLKGPAL